jgi:NitT/TauT family transport system permease protein
MAGSAWRARDVTRPLGGVAVLLVAWAVLAAVTSTSSIPTPLATWRALVRGFEDGSIPEAALKTSIRLAFAFTVAIGVGTLIGVALALSELMRQAFRPIVVALQITPFVAWVPLAVVWFGVTERAVVFVAIVGAFPSLTLATLAALRQVPPPLRRAGRTLGAEGWEMYRHIIFPAALPGYMAGIQQAWGFAWKSLLAGELIVASTQASGLGHLLARRAATDVPGILAVLSVIALIGLAVDYLVIGLMDRRIRARRGLLPSD